MQVSRAQWRDAVKEDQRLTEHEAWIGILVADYWKSESDEPLWAAAEVLMRQSRLSRTMVFRALKGLRQKGYLDEVQKARPNRSPRWLPTLPNPEECLQDTEQSLQDTEECLEDHRNPTYSTRTPDVGSSDLGPTQSAPTAHASGEFDPEPTSRKEQADFELLRAHMTNFQDEAVALLYSWMRTGERMGRNGAKGKACEFPGAFAAKKHRKASKIEGVSEWQGWFLRNPLCNNDPDKKAYPSVRRLAGVA